MEQLEGYAITSGIMSGIVLLLSGYFAESDDVDYLEVGLSSFKYSAF